MDGGARRARADDRAGRAHVHHLPAVGREHPRARPDARPLRGGPRALRAARILGGLRRIPRSPREAPARRPRGARRRRREQRRGARLRGRALPHGRRGGDRSARGVRRRALRRRAADRARGRRGRRARRARRLPTAGAVRDRSGSSSTVWPTRSPPGCRTTGCSARRSSVRASRRSCRTRPTVCSPSTHSDGSPRGTRRCTPSSATRRTRRLGRRCQDLLGLDRDTVLADGAAGDGEARDTEIRTSEGTKKDAAPADERDPRRRGGAARPDRRRSRRERGDPRRADQARLRLDGVARAADAVDAAEGVPDEPRRGHGRGLPRAARGVLPDHAPPGAASGTDRERHARRLADRGRRSGHRPPAGAAGPRAGAPGEGVPGAAPGPSRRHR